MSTTSDGITYFYSYFEDAELKFGVPTAMALKTAESTKLGFPHFGSSAESVGAFRVHRASERGRGMAQISER